MNPVRSSHGALDSVFVKESENCPSPWRATGLSNGVKRSLFIFLIVIGGCATAGGQEGQIKDLQAQIIEMNKAITALSRQVEELDNNLLILDGKVKDNYQALGELKPLILKG